MHAVNKIRIRANLPALTPGLSKDQFRDAVLFERHLELAYEEVRWFDLKRTGKLKDALIAAGKTWDDRYYLFPIPQSEIDASNGVDYSKIGLLSLLKAFGIIIIKLNKALYSFY